jgi:hypothetical protein
MPAAVFAVRLDLLDDLRRADERLRAVNKKLTRAVQATGTSLTEIFGVGRSATPSTST